MDQTIGVKFEIGADASAVNALKRTEAATASLMGIEAKYQKALQDREAVVKRLAAEQQKLEKAGASPEMLKQFQKGANAQLDMRAVNAQRAAALREYNAAVAHQQQVTSWNNQMIAPKGGGSGYGNKNLTPDQVLAARQATFQQALALGQMGGFASKYGQISALGETATAAGFKGMGGMLSKAALPLAIASSGLNLGKAGADVMYDEYLTDEQRSREFAKSLPGGEWLQDTIDTFSGRKRAMARAQENNQLAEAVRQVRQHKASYTLNYQNRQDSADAMVSATAGASIIPLPTADRSTAAGRTLYREQMQLLPLQEDAAKAEREATAARLTSVSAAGRLVDLQKEGNKLAMERTTIEEKLKTEGAGPMRVALLGQRERLESDIMANNERQRSQASAVAESQQNAAQANSASRQRQIAIEQGKLSIIEQRESSLSDQAVNLGMMGVGGRMQAMQNLRIARTMGLNAMTGDMISSAASIAPNTIRAMAEAEGQRHFGELRKLAPDENPEWNLGKLRRDRDSTATGIRNMKLMDEKQLAVEMSGALKPIKESIVTFLSDVTATMEHFRAQLKNIRSQKI